MAAFGVGVLVVFLCLLVSVSSSSSLHFRRSRSGDVDSISPSSILPHDPSLSSSSSNNSPSFSSGGIVSKFHERRRRSSGGSMLQLGEGRLSPAEDTARRYFLAYASELTKLNSAKHAGGDTVNQKSTEPTAARTAAVSFRSLNYGSAVAGGTRAAHPFSNHVKHKFGKNCLNNNKIFVADDPTHTKNNYSEKTLCAAMVDNLKDAFEDEKSFRTQCLETFGDESCYEECRSLANLFDQTVINLKPSYQKHDYFWQSNNKYLGYKLNQQDCEECLLTYSCFQDPVVVPRWISTKTSYHNNLDYSRSLSLNDFH